MEKFTVRIDSLGNAAFGENPQERGWAVARLLRKVAARVEGGECEGMVRDVNGSRVGGFYFTNGDRCGNEPTEGRDV